MVWLARKAFFGHVPFPVMHVDTGKKFPEMYAFRDRYAEEWNLNLIRERLPADRGDRPDAAAGRPLGGAQDRRPEAASSRSTGSTRRHRRHPPRRGGDPRQGARVQPARRDRRSGTSATSRRNSGTSSRPTSRPAPICASIRCCTGPRSTSGATSGARASRWSTLYFAKNGKRYRSLGDQDITSPVDQHGGDRRRDHRRARRPPRRRSAPAAPWTTRPKTPSSACAPTGTCRMAMTCPSRMTGPQASRSRMARSSCASSSSAMSTTASRPWSAACSTTPARCPTARSRRCEGLRASAACRSNGPS